MKRLEDAEKLIAAVRVKRGLEILQLKPQVRGRRQGLRNGGPSSCRVSKEAPRQKLSLHPEGWGGMA